MVQTIRAGASLFLARFGFLSLFLVFFIAKVQAIEIQTDKESLRVTALSQQQITYLSKLKQKQLDQVVTVAVMDDQGQLMGQVWGTVALYPDGLEFTPRFPFENNRQYFARFQLDGNKNPATIHKSFSFITEDRQPESSVLQVYPSAGSLPANLSKFYIVFSHPMSRGEAYQHIHLIDANQQPVESPFLKFTQELWDPDNKGFTLLFNPARTQKNNKPNDNMSLPLQPGKQFTLVIDSAWRDDKGLPLRNEFRKTFLVDQQDHQQPDINRWALTLPNSGSRNPVIVKFDEPMDRTQLENALWIETDDGKLISGDVDIIDELVWRFTPALGWRSGDYRLVARSHLEDRAANSLGRLFETIGADGNSEMPDTYNLAFSLAN